MSAITVTDQITGTTATIEVADLADTIRPWYEDAPAEVEQAITDLAAAYARQDTAYLDLAEFLALRIEHFNPITNSDITGALRDADIEHRVDRDRSIVVTRSDGREVAFGPNEIDGNGSSDFAAGIDLTHYRGTVADGDFGSHDWFATVDEAVTYVAAWLAR